MIWKVEITGDRFDLEELSKLLKDKDLSVVKENEHFILKSEDFDILSDYKEVKTKVNELLNSVNAIAQLTLDSREVIKYNHISQLDENGIERIFIESETRSFGRAYIHEISHSDETKICNQIENWIKIAQADPFVKKVFTQINYGFNSWVALYNILEILQQVQFEPLGKNGAYRDKLNDITRTANSYETILEESRHPGKSISSPKNKIEFLEAKSFTKMVLLQWLTQKEQEWINQKNRSI